MIRLLRTPTGLSFPDFEEGSRVGELAQQIATALATSTRKATGSLLEVLVGFQDYPDEFALWWDGVTCELGCSSPCGVNIDLIAERLLSSNLFAQD